MLSYMLRDLSNIHISFESLGLEHPPLPPLQGKLYFSTQFSTKRSQERMSRLLGLSKEMCYTSSL